MILSPIKTLISSSNKLPKVQIRSSWAIMKIFVKVLHSNTGQFEIEVSENETIGYLKQEIERLQGFPIAHQKLLLIGKTLSDENKLLKDSNIKENTKLTLVIKKPDSLKDVLQRNFQKSYPDDNAELLSKAFFTDFEKKISQFSLDDLERLAADMSKPKQKGQLST